MTKTLNEAELRALSVLIEKSLTQPSSCPLTANAITQGCNQRQNRDPVVNYTETEVLHTLQRLESKGLVQHASPTAGARVHRFAHRVVDQFQCDRYEQAIMAELMLRGHQTAGELRTHASRMVPFEELSAVVGTLEALMAHDPPCVEELPREPGRSACRFRHLLLADPTTSTAPPVAAVGQRTSEDDDPPAAFSDRVARLETRVARLAETVERLQRKVEGSTESLDHEL